MDLPDGSRQRTSAAAETAAKMQMKTAKLKMQMETAKLRLQQATAAYEAAKSAEDIAVEFVKPKGLQERRRRSPAYQRRLQRRLKEREEAAEAKEVVRADKHATEADTVAIVRFAARRCSEMDVRRRRAEREAVRAEKQRQENEAKLQPKQPEKEKQLEKQAKLAMDADWAMLQLQFWRSIGMQMRI